MQARWHVIPLVALLALAGCVTESPDEDGRAGTGNGDADTGTGAPETPGPKAQPLALMSTGCHEAFMQIPTDAANVRGLVPERFTLELDDTGHAIIGLGIASCEGVTLDGMEIGAVRASEVAIRIDAPDGSPGDHYYYAWHVTSSPALRERLATFGLEGAVVPDVAFDVENPVPTMEILDARVPWTGNAYAYRVLANAAPAENDFATTKWYLGDRGLLRVDQSFTVYDSGAAIGDVGTDSGTRLYDMMGRDTFKAPGIHGHYEATSTFEIVPR